VTQRFSQRNTKEYKFFFGVKAKRQIPVGVNRKVAEKFQGAQKGNSFLKTKKPLRFLRISFGVFAMKNLSPRSSNEPAPQSGLGAFPASLR